MATPHNAANPGDFASTVLMPGDPLRAKFIAENFLQAPRLVTQVRGMLGYTGTYEGVPVSVMGSGMGMPSIGIYSWELFTQYGVENIIRVGSAGAYAAEAKIFDVVLATAAYSESSYAQTQNGTAGDTMLPSPVLNQRLRASAKKLGIPLLEGVMCSIGMQMTRIIGKSCAETKGAWLWRWRALHCFTMPASREKTLLVC